MSFCPDLVEEQMDRGEAGSLVFYPSPYKVRTTVVAGGCSR